MSTTTFRAAYAQYLLNKQLLGKYNDLHDKNATTLPKIDAKHWSALFDANIEPDYDQAICIIGAGPAGLSAALFLQQIGFKNITIYEASSRVGGRCYTYTFENGPDCPHNYYDAGAMRLPKIATQKSTFNMIAWLNDNKHKVPLARYVHSDDDKEPSWYEFDNNAGFDPYMKDLLIKQGFPIVETGPGPILPDPPVASDQFQTANDHSKKDFVKAYFDFIGNTEMKPDHYSTRSWLMNSPHGPGWDFYRTQVAQTYDTSTGLFDQAFMETIADWFDFNTAKEWYRVEGGMSALTNALRDATLAHSSPPRFEMTSPVVAMQETEDKTSIRVTHKNSAGSKSSADYKAVFNTTTLGCLQRMDLTGLNLEPDNTCAIRSLSYDRATKVAIKFKKPWWRDLIREGGVSSTDMCVGSVVYPSWDDGEDTAHTIIVSYTWAQDATRMAALCKTNDIESTDVSEEIIQLCLRDLATLWTKKTIYPQTVEGLQKLYCAHHVFAWSHDPNSAGAFALFGPGQFEYLYKQFTKPLVGNKLSICGEAISAHHAWISGAFDSAYNAVLTWCTAKKYNDAARRLKGSPFALGEEQDTAEYDPTLVFWNLALAKFEQEQKAAAHTQ